MKNVTTTTIFTDPSKAVVWQPKAWSIFLEAGYTQTKIYEFSYPIADLYNYIPGKENNTLS